MKRLGLFSKTFLFTMLLMSAIILVSHMLLYFMLPEFYIQHKNQEIETISADITEEMQSKSLDEVLKIAENYNKNENVNVLIQTGDNTYSFSAFAITSSATTTDGIATESQMIVDDDVIYSAESIMETYSFPAMTLYNYDSQITLENEITLVDGTITKVLTSVDLQPVSEASDVILLVLPYTIGISILISLCAAYFYAKAITNPIRAICASTKQMEKMDRDIVCSVKTQDEIGELASDINSLYATLQGTIISLEQEIEHVSEVEHRKVDFLRSASHELKTPLTSISVILENMLLDIGKYKNHDVYLKKCKTIVDELSHMIKEILDASSIEGVYQVDQKEDIDVASWLRKIGEPYVLIARSKGIKIQMELDEGIILHQNQSLLQKIIANALSNAVQYTSEGKVTIRLQDAQIIIENECVPIAKEHLSHLSEAFYRPEFSRTKESGGNGLGLYIIDQVAAILQLTYSFQPYEKGMRFILYLK